MNPQKTTTAILHYTAPPVVGGVEGVMDAHTRIFLQMGYPVSIVAGRGSTNALPPGTEFTRIPELDTQHPNILAAGAILERGQVPDEFAELKRGLIAALEGPLSKFDNLIVHNIFTKHFNLPLTAALFDLLDLGVIGNCIAWHHDFTWTSPRSGSKVHPGYPWDLLRTYRSDVTHVTISKSRQLELAGLYQCPAEKIRVIYNGVDPAEMFGFTAVGWQLVQRLDLLASDLILLMPVRVTRAKNIEFALEVVKLLKMEGIKVKLIHTGPPDPHDETSIGYLRSLQKLRDDLGLNSEMHFVYESGPNPDEPFLISLDVVADLYRVSDMLFMPSHQEGFGMPVLEAGLLGLPVAASNAVPAAEELGGEDILRFSLDQPPHDLVRHILTWLEEDQRSNLARRTRQNYTWYAIFQHEIEPILARSNPR